MRIALITTPTRIYTPNTILPLGALHLAAYLEMSGHSVKVIDVARTRQDIASTIREIREFMPDVIGVSGIITAYRFVKELVRAIKKAYPLIPVVVGGHITIDNADQLIHEAGCDYVVTGYGEKPLLMFLEYMEGKRAIDSVPQLSYLNAGNVVKNPHSAFFKNVDEIPFPAYGHVDMEYYLTASPRNPKLDMYIKKTGKKAPPMRFAPVNGALGCTDRCSFCVHEFEYKGFHMHSVEYVIRNIRMLHDGYGARIFGMGEDLFLYNPQQARAFADAMNRNFPDAYFSCSVRADYITPELLEALKTSNCFYLAYGFESGDDSILKILGKRMSRSTNIRAYKLISNTHITPACSIMVGTPGETRNTIQNTIAAVEEAEIVNSAVFFTTPYPGARLFRWCREQGLIKDVDAYLEKVSNRDASVLSINFTPFPDMVVRMMKIMVQNALERNKRRKDPLYKMSYKRYVVYHCFVPMVFEAYFALRSILAVFFSRYGKNAIDIKLNGEGTVLLSCDKEPLA